MELYFSIEFDATDREPVPDRSPRRERSEGLAARARILKNTLFPPAKAMRVVYQTDNLLKAYLIRPFDLFARYTRLGRRLFKHREARDNSVASRMRTLNNTDIIRKWILSPSDPADRK